MNVELKKGVLELIVLEQIRQKDQYGYELATNVSKYLTIADGTLYPMLRKLVKANVLYSYSGQVSEGPARKYYKLTNEGKGYLETLKIEWYEIVSAVEAALKS